jgi:hypothetical protein
VYLHLGEELKRMKGGLLIGMFLAGLIGNGVLEDYEVPELVGKLQTLEEFADNTIVEDYFCGYRNRELLIKNQEEGIAVGRPLNDKYKLLFTSLAFIEPAFAAPEVDSAIMD